jgi:hypothetical protein
MKFTRNLKESSYSGGVSIHGNIIQQYSTRSGCKVRIGNDWFILSTRKIEFSALFCVHDQRSSEIFSSKYWMLVGRYNSTSAPAPYVIIHSLRPYVSLLQTQRQGQNFASSRRVEDVSTLSSVRFLELRLHGVFASYRNIAMVLPL